MYKKAYGIIETLAPLHVGATAGEESVRDWHLL